MTEVEETVSTDPCTVQWPLFVVARHPSRGGRFGGEIDKQRKFCCLQEKGEEIPSGPSPKDCERCCECCCECCYRNVVNRTRQRQSGSQEKGVREMQMYGGQNSIKTSILEMPSASALIKSSVTPA